MSGEARPDDRATSEQRPLWTCPRCGNKFVTRNMWHSCQRWTVEQFLEGKGPRAQALRQRLVELVSECGPFEYTATKNRIGFMVRVRFAGVMSLSEQGMTFAFWLKKRIHSPRFAKVEQYTPRDWGYRCGPPRPRSSTTRYSDGCGRHTRWAVSEPTLPSRRRPYLVSLHSR